MLTSQEVRKYCKDTNQYYNDDVSTMHPLLTGIPLTRITIKGTRAVSFNVTAKALLALCSIAFFLIGIDRLVLNNLGNMPVWIACVLMFIGAYMLFLIRNPGVGLAEFSYADIEDKAGITILRSASASIDDYNNGYKDTGSAIIHDVINVINGNNLVLSYDTAYKALKMCLEVFGSKYDYAKIADTVMSLVPNDYNHVRASFTRKSSPIIAYTVNNDSRHRIHIGLLHPDVGSESTASLYQMDEQYDAWKNYGYYLVDKWNHC